MKNGKFGSLMFVLSLGFSAFAAYLYHLLVWRWGQSSAWQTAGYFVIPLLAGLAGVCLAQWIYGKKHLVRRRGNRLISLGLAVVAAGVLGFGGQQLYALNIGRTSQKPSSDAANISLLVDCSGSMSACLDTCKEAAKQLVDGMDSDAKVQVIAFSQKVLQQTKLIELDDAGKQQVDQAIDDLEIASTTRFDPPLQTALETLQQGNSARQAVILLTDGVSDISRRVEQAYLTAGVPVYLVSVLEDTETVGSQRQALIDFANQTGGFDTVVAKDAAGNTDFTEVLDALQKAYASTRVVVTSGREQIAFGAENLNLWRVFIRLLFFTAYAVLTTYVYYQYISKVGLLINLGVGVAATLFVTLGGLLPGALPKLTGGIVFVLLFWTAFTQYREVSLGDIHVAPSDVDHRLRG